jgi:hypothetical protein
VRVSVNSVVTAKGFSFNMLGACTNAGKGPYREQVRPDRSLPVSDTKLAANLGINERHTEIFVLLYDDAGWLRGNLQGYKQDPDPRVTFTLGFVLRIPMDVEDQVGSHEIVVLDGPP